MTDDPPALEKLKEMRVAVRETGIAETSTPELAAYLDKVRRHAYKITDEDLASLRAAGHSEPQIYEATMVTAMTAGIERFEIGLRALRGAR